MYGCICVNVCVCVCVCVAQKGRLWILINSILPGLTLSTQETKTFFANSVDPVEMARNEPSHQDLYCLHSFLIFD